MKRLIKSINPETVIWTAAIAYLAAIEPHGSCFTICPLHWVGDLIGLHFCPGCGLGSSVSLLLKGRPEASFAAHPLGAFALIAISIRIFVTIKMSVFKYKLIGGSQNGKRTGTNPGNHGSRASIRTGYSR